MVTGCFLPYLPDLAWKCLESMWNINAFPKRLYFYPDLVAQWDNSIPNLGCAFTYPSIYELWRPLEYWLWRAFQVERCCYDWICVFRLFTPLVTSGTKTRPPRGCISVGNSTPSTNWTHKGKGKGIGFITYRVTTYLSCIIGYVGSANDPPNADTRRNGIIYESSDPKGREG